VKENFKRKASQGLHMSFLDDYLANVLRIFSFRS
jgi:hypothetical protein